MKKKGLLITLISTVIVVAVIGGLSIGKILTPPADPSTNPGNQVSNKVSNEGNNKGSKDDPYYIYDTESFTTLLSQYGSEKKPYREAVKDPVMIEVVGANGVETVQKKDEQGNPVFENRKDENGYDVYKTIEGMYESYHFELKNDIDFSGVDFKVLFNNNNAFSGVIDGKGYSVKNISINITKNNLEANMFTKGNATESYAHIGIFGDLRDATIKNITFDNLKIDISNEVYKYLQTPEFWTDFHTALYELSIGSIAACAERSTIEANVNGTINADSYSVYIEDESTGESVTQGRNCVGGIVGYAINSKISSYNNAMSNIKIIADSGTKNYYLGGVAGYMFSSEFSNLKISSEITASAKIKSQTVSNKLWIGGVAGYMHTSTIKDSIVNLKITQLVDEDRVVGSGITAIDNGLYNMVGGVASVIRANSAEQASVISNVRVTSDVDMDCLFGGAVFEVKSTYDSQGADLNANPVVFVNLTDLIIKSNVKTLRAYGVASKLLYTKITYSPTCVYPTEENTSGDPTMYNVLLDGEVVLTGNDDMEVVGLICSNIADSSVYCVDSQGKSGLGIFRIMTSYQINEKLSIADSTRKSFLGGYSHVK